VSNRGKAGGKVHRLYENRFGLCQNARQNVRIIPLIQSPSRPSVVDPLAMQVIVEMKLASVRTEDSARAVARHHSCATRHNSAIKKSQPSTIIVNLESSSAEQSRASRHEHHFTWPQRPYTHANKTSRKTFISFPSPHINSKSPRIHEHPSNHNTSTPRLHLSRRYQKFRIRSVS